MRTDMRSLTVVLSNLAKAPTKTVKTCDVHNVTTTF
jgi:hypothetical protein